MSTSKLLQECGIKALNFNKFAQPNIFHLRKAFKEIT